MKKILFVVLLLSSSAAFGQYYANHLDNTPQVLQIPEHTAHASWGQMGRGTIHYWWRNYQLLPGATGQTSDFPQMAELPLGDAARELRKQHAKVKKARVIWENWSRTRVFPARDFRGTFVRCRGAIRIYTTPFFRELEFSSPC